MEFAGRCALFGMLTFSLPQLGFGQVAVAAVAFPDAPSAGVGAQQAVAGTFVRGVVRDTQGTPLADAHVALIHVGVDGEKNVETGKDGSYEFADVAPGEYRVSVTLDGFVVHISEPFAVKAGERSELPPVALRVSSNTTVDVHATSEQIAEEEVKEQEKQRVLGVFPNFYTSYIWNAKPMPARLKYKLAFRSVFDPVNFIAIGAAAGVQQARNTYPEWGQGAAGYGTRFAAQFGTTLTNRMIGSAILPSLFHQDPRYFYQGSGSFGSRFGHAISSTVVTRGDNGKLQPAYALLLGSLAASAITSAYHPDGERSASDTFQTFGVQIGGHAASNLIREFVLKPLVHSIPNYANGKARP
jgi:hypothetical protein